MNTLTYTHREYFTDKGPLGFLVERNSDCAARLTLSTGGLEAPYVGQSIEVALTKTDFEELLLVLTELLKDWA